jgi:glycerophosphoryl diester phosphodiesterase
VTQSIQPLILGHRGSSAISPENTIASFRQSIEHGADGVEFDVRLALDKVPVVIHDATLSRTAGINRAVAQLTSKELQEIDVGAWFRRSSRVEEEERVPTLSDVFELFRNAGGVLYLEMKGEPVGNELPARVVELMREHSFVERVVVESFDHSAIAEIKRLAPEVRTAALFERRIRRPLVSRKSILSITTAAKADEIALHHTLAGEGLVREARRSGFDVVVWTVEHPRWIQRAQKLDIKGLITNNPANLLLHRV